MKYTHVHVHGTLCVLQVTVVNPLNITKEFSSILANPVIATDVTTKIILHRDL